MVRLLVIGLFLTCAAPVWAQDSMKKNIELLKQSTDFRVRTQAALALGASGSAAAVTPLCQALGDENRTVRIASATALSRLQQGGESCLNDRLAAEKDSMVHAAIEKALARLVGGAEPMLGPHTKYFVALQTLAGPARLNGPIRASFVKAARGNAAVGFAPAGQTEADAQKELAKFKGAKGFLLAPKLSRPVYEGGMLKVKMSVAILTYPGSSLIGSFEKTVGMSGIESQNEKAENELAVSVAEESMKEFLNLAPRLHP